jgi:hypothetical protein
VANYTNRTSSKTAGRGTKIKLPHAAANHRQQPQPPTTGHLISNHPTQPTHPKRPLPWAGTAIPCTEPGASRLFPAKAKGASHIQAMGFARLLHRSMRSQTATATYRVGCTSNTPATPQHTQPGSAATQASQHAQQQVEAALCHTATAYPTIGVNTCCLFQTPTDPTSHNSPGPCTLPNATTQCNLACITHKPHLVRPPPP